MDNADYFDINYIDFNDDKVFYNMPTVEELGLKVGSDAYAVIKATSVMVGIDE